MINLPEKINCCGCGACQNACPKNCLTLQADNEGFLYPRVDKSACVNCGACQRVCPVLKKPETSAVLQTYAAKYTDENIQLKSSSGGVFSALADVILQEGGVVFGAAFDKDWNVVHTYAQRAEKLDALRRSKYVQSNVGFSYKKAKEFLDLGRPVLFTGTPCQVAALRNYLGRSYENLLTADIICHAAPSPGAWQKFLRENFDVPAVKAINFREKKIGWRHSYLSFLLPDGLYAHRKRKNFAERVLGSRILFADAVMRNLFLQAFLRELINRPSCHTCHFKGLNARLSDITLGDLWGPWPEITTPTDEKFGLSCVLVNTPKGQAYFEKIKHALWTTPVSLARVAQYNPSLETSIRPHLKRAEFFQRYHTEKFDPLVRRLLGLRPWWAIVCYRGARYMAARVYHLFR